MDVPPTDLYGHIDRPSRPRVRYGCSMGQFVNSIQNVREAMLQSLEGGQFHLRETIKQCGSLPYADFLSIGLALRKKYQDPLQHNELIARLRPHADIIIGALPPGVQGHGLLPKPDELVDPAFITLELHDITDAQLRQWITDDGSLVYGELSREELQNYFAALSPFLTPGGHFLDLGSGLGKVVMSAGLYFPFATCKGIEVVPYRHRMAVEQLSKMLKAGQSEFLQLFVPAQEHVAIPLPWTADLQVMHLLNLPQRISFEMGDMFGCDVSEANLVFINSTCFGSFIEKIAHKLANEAPPGCLVSTTTYAMNHPGLELIKHFLSNTLAWTDVFVYRRVGAGTWPELPRSSVQMPNLDEWEAKARALMTLP